MTSPDQLQNARHPWGRSSKLDRPHSIRRQLRRCGAREKISEMRMMRHQGRIWSNGVKTLTRFFTPTLKTWVHLPSSMHNVRHVNIRNTTIINYKYYYTHTLIALLNTFMRSYAVWFHEWYIALISGFSLALRSCFRAVLRREHGSHMKCLSKCVNVRPVYFCDDSPDRLVGRTLSLCMFLRTMRLCWVNCFYVQGKCMIILEYFNHLKFLRLCNEWGSFANMQK